MSIGGVLLAVSLIAFLGASLATLSISSQGLLSRSERGLRLRNAARSLVQQAVAKIFQANLAANETFTLSRNGLTGILTFDPSVASRNGMPVSIDNLQNSVSVEVGGSLVPAATARLIGRAQQGSQSAEVELLLYIPPFPYVLASSGPVEARSGVLVGELLSYQLPDSGSLADAVLGPADVGSNSSSSQAVLFDGRSRITGNIETPGEVVLGPQVVIEGEVRGGWGDVAVPRLNPQDYDPVVRGLVFTPVPPPGVPLSGTHRHTGNLVLPSLDLRNAFLYVQGSLEVQGRLKGQGVVVTTGDLRVGGGTDLTAGSLDLALVCGQNAILRGSSPETSAFHGVVYTGGSLDARQVSVVGSVVAHSPVTLEQAAVLEKPAEAPPKRAVLFSQSNGFKLGSWSAKDRNPDSVQSYTANDNATDYIIKFDVQPNPNGGPADYNWTLEVRGRNGGVAASDSGDDYSKLQKTLKVGMQAQGGSPLLAALELDGLFDSHFRSQLARALDHLATAPSEGSEPPINPALILSDLSNITRLADRVRVLQWIER